MSRAAKMALKLLAGASLLGLPAVLMAVPASAIHSWGGYHWARDHNPFPLIFGKNMSLAWDVYVNAAAEDWSTSEVLNATVTVPTVAFNDRKCSPITGKVQVCNYKYGYRGWLGVAQIWLSGKHITQGTVKLNDSYFTLSTYNTPSWRAYVACQEIGHTFGLDHQDEVQTNPNLGTCMDYTNNPNPVPPLLNNEKPNAHDYDQLVTIYSPHLDTYNSASTTVMAVGQPADDWGKAVRFTKSGKGRVFVKNLGANQQVVTFVIWATE
jgi:hypothetical protein